MIQIAADHGADKKWRNEMQKMKAALTRLLSYASTVESYNKPENAVPIDKNIKRMVASSRALNLSDGAGPLKDPTVGFVARYFDMNLKEITESNMRGRRDYARFLILNSTAFCIECHTRRKTDPDLTGLRTDSSLSFMNPVERVEYLISVRQFHDALELVQKSLREEKPLPLFGGERLLFYGLTLAVRYYGSQDETAKLIETARSAKTIPVFIKNDMPRWTYSLAEWKKEKPGSRDVNQVLRDAQKLIERARELNTKAQSLHAGEVDLLRANGMLVELFAVDLNSVQQAARAMFLIGQTYQLLPEHLFWVLHEAYYEACIRLLPRSPQAAECFRSLEESVLLGYTGTRGTVVPSDVLKRLKDLKELSDEKMLKENLL
jgi:hypothetical protein